MTALEHAARDPDRDLAESQESLQYAEAPPSSRVSHDRGN